jgi:DNA-binding transcriptional ArsR family regulator
VKTTEAAETQAALFAALSTESRVRIVQLLSKDTLCVGALSRSTGISAGAVSQHLRILRSAGLVQSERRGYFIHYRLTPGAAGRLRTALAAVVNPKRGARACATKALCVRGGSKPLK